MAPTTKSRGYDDPSSTVSTSINDLDDTLLTEILKRLPNAREAIACKLVSKNWCSLFSAPYFGSRFIDHYHKCHLKEPTGFAFIAGCGQFFAHEGHVYNKLSKSLRKFQPFKPHSTLVITSYNDLLLCRSPSESTRNCNSYYICNPLTKKLQYLPPFTRTQDFRVMVSIVCGDH
ncbi:hypothetical protein Tsubulata_044811 [Turnera subulata]|uniref:F-box domain-containing protein n=1 Tax=Turnera subulata TaxID=218843 RepID=A0A9Q0F7L3_9ROSI|nr:hypothetical protein Tsubulata_044811 [Turnera subulata]